VTLTEHRLSAVGGRIDVVDSAVSPIAEDLADTMI
jgi:hypothetical protein